ncbi:MAG: DUF4352 domain-containing protein [Oscillospiraceae bacterium]|jgi:hypothetical protein|nr:DUF4352 domain-containing protein [Oscillospiraceae bacterium]
MKKLIAPLLALALAAAMLAGCGATSDTPSHGDGDAPASSSPSSKDETFKLGETAVFKSLKISANKIERSGGSEYNEPGAGNVFLGVQFTIENVSDEEQTISSYLLFEAYADDVKLDQSIWASVEFSDGTLDGSLSPGKKMTGYYAVEVPDDAEVLELEVKSSWLSSSKAIFVIDIPE